MSDPNNRPRTQEEKDTAYQVQLGANSSTEHTIFEEVNEGLMCAMAELEVLKRQSSHYQHSQYPAQNMQTQEDLDHYQHGQGHDHVHAQGVPQVDHHCYTQVWNPDHPKVIAHEIQMDRFVLGQRQTHSIYPVHPRMDPHSHSPSSHSHSQSHSDSSHHVQPQTESHYSRSNTQASHLLPPQKNRHVSAPGHAASSVLFSRRTHHRSSTRHRDENSATPSMGASHTRDQRHGHTSQPSSLRAHSTSSASRSGVGRHSDAFATMVEEVDAEFRDYVNAKLARRHTRR